MKHTAERLIPFAENKVIHYDKVSDPVLKRMLRNTRVIPHIRSALKEIDTQLELLIPYKVDEEELQLKRYIQYHIGTTVNLSVLRKKFPKYYKGLYKYGSPRGVIRDWGLTPTLNSLTETELLEALKPFTRSDGVISNVSSKDTRLYRSLLYFSAKNGMTINEFIEKHGMAYKG